MAGDGTEELRTGLAVRGADGRRLGTLVGLEAGVLVVERGFFWPQRFTISRSDVGTVTDGEVRLLEGAALRESHTGAPLVEPTRPAEALPHEGAGTSVRAEGDDVRVPWRARTRIRCCACATWARCACARWCAPS